MLTGDTFSPQRAYEIGIVNKVVPHENLLDATFDMAERILRHSPVAAARILAAVTRGLNATIGEGLQIESEQFARMVPTLDIREGLAAWIERRSPNYIGR